MSDLSPAEELREAAKLMRERAEKATPGPWRVHVIPPRTSGFDRLPAAYMVRAGDVNVAGSDEMSAAHIAAMHPAVALALADWLMLGVPDYEEHNASTQEFLASDHGGDPDPAIVVARAYLAGESP